MSELKRSLFFLILLTYVFRSSAENVDSLKAKLPKVTNEDKVVLLIRIGNFYLSLNNDSAIRYSTLGVQLAHKRKLSVLEAQGTNNIGSAYLMKGEFANALQAYIEAETLYEKEKDLEGKALVTVNIGNVYEFQGLVDKAFIQYNNAISIAKEISNKEIHAQTLGRLGSIEYLYRKNKSKALAYFIEALKISEESKNVSRAMECLNNIAVIYQEMGKFNEALVYFNTDLEYARKMNIKSDIIATLHNIGLVYKDKKEVEKAIAYIDSSIILAKEANDFASIKEATSSLYEIYLSKKDLAKALEYFQLSVTAKDSMMAMERQKEFAEMSTKYETEKKEKENIQLRNKHELDLAIASEKEKKLNIITYAITGGLIIVILFSFVLSSRLKITRQQKRIIESQKQIVDEKQKEILDSIHYAQRLQNAILAKEEDIQKQFPSSFLLYKPKDIVAGDFYFFENTETHVFYAAADCTGHGVPGALVSIVCSNALSRCVLEFDLSDPGKILDKARELVLDTFKKSGQDVKDGMDISLLVKEKSTGVLKWAGANNPLWKLNASRGLMEEIKANKQPIGLSDDPRPFTSHEIMIEKNDSLYLFTDGLPDQFGGPKARQTGSSFGQGKKYKYKRLEEQLIMCSNKDPKTQKESIQNDLKEWMGSIEQVDDILLIGIRV